MRWLLAPLLWCSCHSTFMTASLYDQSCTTASDCVVVFEGNACGLCGNCPNAAINRKAAAQYAGDRQAISCVDLPFSAKPAVACRECLEAQATCTAGKCTVAR